MCALTCSPVGSTLQITYYFSIHKMSFRPTCSAAGSNGRKISPEEGGRASPEAAKETEASAGEATSATPAEEKARAPQQRTPGRRPKCPLPIRRRKPAPYGSPAARTWLSALLDHSIKSYISYYSLFSFATFRLCLASFALRAFLNRFIFFCPSL